MISTSSVAGRLEPLMARAPIELYDSSFPTEINTNKLIEGFSDFFTAQDARVLDAWLIKSNNKAKTIKLETDCNVSQSAMPDSVKIRVSCEKFEKTGLFMENATIQVRNSDKQVQLGQIDNLYLYGASPNCSVQAIQTAENRANGSACPAIEQAQAAGSLNGDILTLQPYNVHSGVSARLIDGRLVARMQINLTTKKMEVLISDDIALLTKLVKFPETMNFNRKFVMKSIAAGLGINVEDSEALLPTLEKNVEDDEFTAEQILATYKNPVNAFYHSCGKCHYNNENVPPAFLGNKSVAASLMNRCQRIEMCAPRMLYRLKMRNCAPADIAKFQKIPMPPPYFFPVVKVADQDWQSKVAPQVIQFATKLIKVPEVVAYMVSQGVPQTVAQTTINQLTTADCPNVDYKQYENLPKCDFAQLKQNSSCGSLMSAFGDN